MSSNFCNKLQPEFKTESVVKKKSSTSFLIKSLLETSPKPENEKIEKVSNGFHNFCNHCNLIELQKTYYYYPWFDSYNYMSKLIN